MIQVTLQLHLGGEDYVATYAQMPVVPREDEMIEIGDKIYHVDNVCHSKEDGDWAIYVWTKLAD